MPEGIGSAIGMFIFVCLVAGGVIATSDNDSRASSNRATHRAETQTVRLTCSTGAERGKLTIRLARRNKGPVWAVTSATFTSAVPRKITMHSDGRRVYTAVVPAGTTGLDTMALYDVSRRHTLACTSPRRR